MKALLVIDMPNNCMECPLFREEFTLCPNIEKPLDEGKPNWCPLRPTPEQMSWGHTADYIEGYNACLNEITGEKR